MRKVVTCGNKRRYILCDMDYNLNFASKEYCVVLYKTGIKHLDYIYILSTLWLLLRSW